MIYTNMNLEGVVVGYIIMSRVYLDERVYKLFYRLCTERYILVKNVAKSLFRSDSDRVRIST